MLRWAYQDVTPKRCWMTTRLPKPVSQVTRDDAAVARRGDGHAPAGGVVHARVERVAARPEAVADRRRDRRRGSAARWSAARDAGPRASPGRPGRRRRAPPRPGSGAAPRPSARRGRRPPGRTGSPGGRAGTAAPRRPSRGGPRRARAGRATGARASRARRRVSGPAMPSTASPVRAWKRADRARRAGPAHAVDGAGVEAPRAQGDLERGAVLGLPAAADASSAHTAAAATAAAIHRNMFMPEPLRGAPKSLPCSPALTRGATSPAPPDGPAPLEVSRRRRAGGVGRPGGVRASARAGRCAARRPTASRRVHVAVLPEHPRVRVVGQAQLERRPSARRAAPAARTGASSSTRVSRLRGIRSAEPM